MLKNPVRRQKLPVFANSNAAIQFLTPSWEPESVTQNSDIDPKPGAWKVEVSSQEQ